MEREGSWVDNRSCIICPASYVQGVVKLLDRAPHLLLLLHLRLRLRCLGLRRKEAEQGLALGLGLQGRKGQPIVILLIL